MLSAADVLNHLQALADPARAAGMVRFFKTGPGQYGEGDEFLGLTMPQQRVLAQEFRALPIAAVEQLLRSPWHESRAVAVVIWTLQFAKTDLAGRQVIYERYLANRHFVNNWDLVDISAPTLLGGYLLNNTREPLYELAAENHLWSQRMALVATLAFIRQGQFQDTFQLVEQLLGHSHDLLHKAMGWMLREVGKRNEEALDEFLTDHHGQLPRTTLRYAVERLPTERRTWHMRK